MARDLAGVLMEEHPRIGVAVSTGLAILLVPVVVAVFFAGLLGFAAVSYERPDSGEPDMFGGRYREPDGPGLPTLDTAPKSTGWLGLGPRYRMAVQWGGETRDGTTVRSIHALAESVEEEDLREMAYAISDGEPHADLLWLEFSETPVASDDFVGLEEGDLAGWDRDGAVIEINSEEGAAVGNDAIGGDAPYFSPEGGTEDDGAYVYTKDQMEGYDSWGRLWNDIESRTLS